MKMTDWINELYSFLTLKTNGNISHKQALEKAHKEYNKYMKNHLTKAEKDYLEIMNLQLKELE